jgi:hypothetical protein
VRVLGRVVVERGEPLTGNDFLTTRPRLRRLALGVVLACGLAVTAGAVQVVRHSSASPNRTGSATTATTPTPATAPVPEPGPVAIADGVTDDLPAGTGTVTLPRGTSRVGTIRTGYPKTLRGAVAAAVEYTGQEGCLTITCARAFEQAAVDPTWTGGWAEQVKGVRLSRAKIGLSGQDGPVPAGAWLSATAMAFQIVPVPADTIRAGDTAAHVRVLLLTYLSSAGPGINPVTQVFAYPRTLRWTGQDWKLVGGNRAYPELVARPGTPQAAALGWRDFAA